MPHEPHPTSGCGHSPTRPHAAHRARTHASDQFRCDSTAGGADGSSGSTAGAPHAQGKAGAV
ncbi:hypothetical protein ACYTFC_05455 [Streptomyces globosus]|uniref:hypothetical protein n=1 Tax=Streptomyces TaxID=1883 RepID=UPI0021AEDAFB|nr:hypothetical protein [Streptomyces sp. WAC05292]